MHYPLPALRHYRTLSGRTACDRSQPAGGAQHNRGLSEESDDYEEPLPDRRESPGVG